MALTQVQPGMLGTPQPYNFKNRIINGQMQIDQRNAGASTTFNSSSQYGIDRWASYSQSGTSNTLQQVADAPAGFSSSAKITIGTGSSPTANQQNIFWQPIEGYNVADLNFGSANAKTVTFSFWVKSSVTGTMNVWFENNGSARSYVSTYTVNSANTWEQKSVTFAGDTAGTWLTTNAAGILAGFSLGMGSNFNATANTWVSGDYKATSGATAVVATSGATWQVTGVQLEVGVSATGFDYRPYGTELALCQRYFQLGQFSGVIAAAQPGLGASYSAYQAYSGLPVAMRTTPSSTSTQAGNQANFSWVEGQNVRQATCYPNTPQSVYIGVYNGSSATDGKAYVITINGGAGSSAPFYLSAEL